MKGPELSETIELDDATPEGVRAAFIVRFGPRCAGWLIRRMRRRLRAIGRLVLSFPTAGEDLPPWFDIAISFLESRRGWLVERACRRGTRYFVVHRVPRAIPDVIRPAGIS